MKRYAVEIGKIMIVSDKPIDDAKRKKIIELMDALGENTLRIDGVRLCVNRH